jgi:chromate transport protein ChrA
MKANHPSDEQTAPIYSLWDLVRYALRLGTFGFGGPVALVGYMHRDLVERRKWISETDYKEGLTLAILLVTLLLLWKVKKLPEPAIVALSAVAGLIVYPLSRG